MSTFTNFASVAADRHSGLDWFALTVKPRHDKAVGAALESKGFESLVPTYRKRSYYVTREKESELPLFPGYVFCRFDPAARLPILTTPGVLNIIGAGPTALRVDEIEINSLRCALHSKVALQPHPFLHAGQKVRIKEGPLSGLQGVIVRVKPNPGIVVSITLLQRSVLLEIDSDSVIVQDPQPAEVKKATCS